MFSTISWQQYCIFLIIANVVYYLFVWIVFFKAKLSFLTGAGRMRSFFQHSDDEPDEVMTTAQHVMDEIRPLFNRRSNKNELILSLQLHLKKYNQWNETGFRDTVNDFIASQSESKCSIRLGEEDQRAVWL